MVARRAVWCATDSRLTRPVRRTAQ
jgi:hypothetical protein